ncbi:pyruvate/2-oxoglutarate/acetoin dehydrogenase E1 component/TPP-dependent pyruvate/acetoin dehydrogenase alpha subunit [Filimonas zeae]|uniref:3-methyl-2-oxobutanoate dehydrogenase (2-methylpropanoyl-transferring) n=2 Tax=Filimonas zeae TaxID=1737353 RepID=A0A917J181_9BACT|nr:alpha-ketoacid dehydrogenase subunit alpha/beta [Filimonas zeae]MDR6341589.1 pyruvate/2-oxoglutarate/acetoin dehydrogenase E1 component/TPP-dependent pyruvate/acetoin dehydrogenase alpha subunit [Filimonas zeae]GGH75139.1 transketolase [Filimonas zeae]
MSNYMLSYEGFRAEVLNDYKVALESREASLLGRREVLTGKAKFGIFGDGKELAQVAMGKFFQPGDYRAGYYRDQTFMFATGLATVEQFFAQLYADPDLEREPFSMGRQMNGHFATPNVDASGEWVDLANQRNISSDISPTAAQMPRALGLAFASTLFRNSPVLQQFDNLSTNGNEVCFCTIGDASTSEGHFWETVNAAGVLQVPLAIFIWDDGYGISVPREYQTTKGSISAALKGFEKKEDTNGIDIYRVKGWDYAGMCEVFESGLQKIRDTHTPAVFHVEEITQPQGHSTSGSHERYKSTERLEWEKEWDCIKQMREFIIENGLGDEEELTVIEENAKKYVRDCKNRAWEKYLVPIKEQVNEVTGLIKNTVVNDIEAHGRLQQLAKDLETNREPLRRDIMRTLSQAVEIAGASPSAGDLKAYRSELKKLNKQLYNTLLYNEGPKSALHVAGNAATYGNNSPSVNGYEILNKYFDQLFSANPKVVAFGEDVGNIGDVNQGFAGLQEKHGVERIFDTGIRELTIMGQGIGLALRGLRPIAEIQYLDYLLYGLEPLSDDVASLHYRTGGQQSCPLIVRTRGHRLEGIWHSGSPMGMIINSLRGMYVCVPRNMVQAIGMYNTLLQSNDPAIMIECLNGYRLKERMPENLLDFTVPLGIPEVVREGTDITVVSYGATLRIVQEAGVRLAALGIDIEIIDVQTLLPFDINHSIFASLKKTNRILFVDEDVPGGAAAYMFNKVMEEQGGYKWLDVAPRTITGQAHRPAYGSDGDYFSKPNTEDVIEVIQEMMSE